MRGASFAKGHGTQNDFVVLVDREDMHPLSAEHVRSLCDRRAGLGGDGVLRAVLAKHVEGWRGDGDLWFMDYRNADGSLAEMCGNGVRVFVRHLIDEGLAYGPTLTVATRAGERDVDVLPDGRIRVAMGPVVVAPAGVTITTVDGTEHRATPVDVGNPHAVSFVPDVAAVRLAGPPTYPADAFPEGVNAEFVQTLGRHHVAMRVFERGSGETRSCGTGCVAAAAAAVTRAPHQADPSPDHPVTFRVEVPGGAVEVELSDQAYLTGPAVIVARGVLMSV